MWEQRLKSNHQRIDGPGLRMYFEDINHFRTLISERGHVLLHK